MRYKLWVQVEEIDDEADHYENIEEPICIGDFDSSVEATERLYALGLLFGGLTDGEHEFFHSETFHSEVHQPEDKEDY